jgi:hypothetical protein
MGNTLANTVLKCITKNGSSETKRPVCKFVIFLTFLKLVQICFTWWHAGKTRDYERIFNKCGVYKAPNLSGTKMTCVAFDGMLPSQ